MRNHDVTSKVQFALIKRSEDFTYNFMTVPKYTGKWQDVVRFLNNLYALNWKWLDKYITGSSAFMDKTKTEFLSSVKK